MKLNRKGFKKAQTLIKAGEVNMDSDWDFSADDGNKILGDDNWSAYGQWFLGVKDDVDAETKEHYAFPFGKDGKVYKKALTAIRQRAAQFKHEDIFEAAGKLIDMFEDDRKKSVVKRHIDYIEETETHYVIHYLKDEHYDETVDEEIEEVEEIEEDIDMYRNLTTQEGFERRFFNKTEMRIDEGNPRTVVGYASIFNSLSQDLGGFRELISERAFEGVMNDDLSTNEANFLKDYVGPTLMQYALYLVLPHLKYKMVEKGLLSGSSEETTQTSLDELKYMRESALDTAQFYDERMREYLSDNPGMFPQYETPGTDGMYPNRKTPYFSGLVTDVRKKKFNYYEEKCDGCPSDGPAVEN